MLNNLKYSISVCLLGSVSLSGIAQVMTREDSLRAGLTPKTSPTVISAYGEAKVAYDLRNKTGVANLTRNVLFLGHRFNDKISLFSETEIEDAKVAGGEPGGEIALEQLLLKFNVSRTSYLIAGLFVPRIGSINENHLPTTFNGNDRPFVETFVIPSTWRELGVSFYATSQRIAGLNYSLAVMNGLNSADFSLGSGIREGRFEGRDATASNLAVTGALLYYYKNWRMQISAYYGGSAGLNKQTADSLELEYGAFGTGVGVYEANVQYLSKTWQFRLLAASVNISEAKSINRAYGNNIPQAMIGGYAELGYNLLTLFNASTEKNLTVFARYEYMDLNSRIPDNAVNDDFQKKQYLIAGITFQPVKGVSIKADFVQRTTGNYNTSFYSANPYAANLPFYNTCNFVNLGIGYSF